MYMKTSRKTPSTQTTLWIWNHSFQVCHKVKYLGTVTENNDMTTEIKARVAVSRCQMLLDNPKVIEISHTELTVYVHPIRLYVP